jgi:tetratricopeptide (TPR) repeat protein
MTAALANLGNAYFARGKYDAAVEQYKKAVRIKGDDAVIYYNLGAAYSNSGRYKEAVAEYLKAIEREPGVGDAHNGLGFGFYKLKEYDLAWKHIKKAEELGVDVAEDLLAVIEDKLQ